MSDDKWPKDLLKCTTTYSTHIMVCPKCGNGNKVYLGDPDDCTSYCADAFRCWSCRSVMVDHNADLFDLGIDDLDEGEDWKGYLGIDDGEKP